ncbi:MAG: gamma-glutamyltransferase, partial [Pseudomonadota bacterium]
MPALRLASLLLLSLFCASPTAAQDADAGRAAPEPATGWTAKPLVTAEREMIVTANPLATDAGAAVLAEGGSAADATIAALLVLNVVEPQSAGLGGGAFALVHGPDGLTTLDGRETAPMAAGPDLFLQNGTALPWPVAAGTGLAIGAPGLGRLLEELQRRHGRLDWPRLVAPALTLARDGFAVSPRLAGLIERLAARLAGTDAGAVFLPGGRPLAEGTVLRQPQLAATLEAIAAAGPSVLYAGPIAEEIVA